MPGFAIDQELLARVQVQLERQKRAAEGQEEPSSYQLDQAAHVRGADDIIGGIEHNKKHSPGQYWLDPFVRGPIREAYNRIDRNASAARVQHPNTLGWMSGKLNPLSLVGWPLAGLMGTAKDRTAARQVHEQGPGGIQARQEAQEDERQEGGALDGRKPPKPEDLWPVGVDNLGEQGYFDQEVGTRQHVRAQSPGDYWLNPFVGGPVTEIMDRLQRRRAALRSEHPLAGYAMPVATAVARGIPHVGALAGPVALLGEAAASSTANQVTGRRQLARLPERRADEESDKKEVKAKKASLRLYHHLRHQAPALRRR